MTRTIATAAVALAPLMLSTACAPRASMTQLSTPATADLDPQAIDAAIAALALEIDDAWRLDEIDRAAGQSLHLLRVASTTGSRVWPNNDLTLCVYRGAARIRRNNQIRTAERGDVFHIPRGTALSIQDARDADFVGVLISTPPLAPDEAGRTLEPGARSYPRATGEVTSGS